MKRYLGALYLVCLALGAGAQEPYPNRPINIIVPNPPGGMNDITGRPLANVMQGILKQPVVVQNKAGGTGAVGTVFVATQKPDGYNLLITTPNLFLVVEKNRVFGEPLAYQLEQIAPLALLSADPLIMVVQNENPAKTVKEFIEFAKAKGGALTYASSGPYGILHVPIEMFLQSAGLKLRHIPTTGGGPALIQLLGGHAQLSAGGPAAVHPHIASGKLRALASWGTARIPGMQDVVTLKELGVPAEAYLWVGLFNTAGVPDATLKVLRSAISRAAKDPQFVDAMQKINSIIDYRDAPEFKKFFDDDHARLAEAVKRIGKVEVK
jgi:tripartite-type tricarboxylate transporter receptor subunit TctC